MPFDIHAVRAQFPALASDAVYFDNPGGTQVPRRVVERMADYLVRCNANHGGAFPTSVQSDAILEAAHAAMADLLNCRPDEVVFGPNMTTLTLHVSRSLARRLQPGDEIVVTRLDHDANIAPWLLVAEDRGAVIRWVDLHEADCTLRMEDFQALIGPRTKIVAVGYASNAVGTINDVAAVVRLAHAVGALVYVDAVQFAPHGVIDVQALECDFLACSPYKFFGPHAGVLYGRRELLEALPAYKVRPATDEPPGKWETGTQNHEGQAGVLGAVEYLEWLGAEDQSQALTPNLQALVTRNDPERRRRLVRGLALLADYERTLGARLVAGLQTLPGLTIYGITDPARFDQRVPTVSFTVAGWHPRRIAEQLAEHAIYVWDGNYYALAVAERLGVQAQGGMVRVGLAHYNTAEEVDRLITVLGELRR
ncbi:MAG: cysteine desulfurase-like protein [Anaerolineales bacterium]|nr:cysteine desulfurase-like protein [Anaerolineales bacterium]